MKSICFFSSYFTSGQIPYYVKFYLEELKKHFSQLVLLTNEKAFSNEDLIYLDKNDIKYRLYRNEGYDFGMWYKAFKEFPVSDYDRIGLVNDSCILFKNIDFLFKWIDEKDFDYCGITDSNGLSYHIQSYFLIINKKAIEPVYEYFCKNQVVYNIKEVIKIYEVGMSQFLINKNFKLGAFFSTNYIGEYNPMLYFEKDLLNKGLPVIKKKVIFCSFRKDELLNLIRMNFNIDPLYHIRLIKEINQSEQLIDFNKLTEGVCNRIFKRKIKIFKIKSYFYQYIRKFKFW